MKTKFRFRLRSMFFLILAVAVLVALWNYRDARIRETTEVVESGRKAGVDVEIEWWPETSLRRVGPPAVARSIGWARGLPHVMSVSAIEPTEYTNWFEKLIEAGGATHVSFIGDGFGRRHIDGLVLVGGIEELRFVSTELDSSTVGSLGRLTTLTNLNLHVPPLAYSAAMDEICQLPSLETIDLSVDLDSVSRFREIRSADSLKAATLWLDDAPQPYPWRDLRRFPRLSRIELHGVSNDENVEELAEIATRLNVLHIDLTDTTKEGCESLKKFTSLKHVQLSNMPCDIDVLSNCKQLRVLSITSATISAAALTKLESSVIESLTLEDTFIEGEFQDGITNWRALNRIKLVETNISQQSADRIRNDRRWSSVFIHP